MAYTGTRRLLALFRVSSGLQTLLSTSLPSLKRMMARAAGLLGRQSNALAQRIVERRAGRGLQGANDVDDAVTLKLS